MNDVETTNETIELVKTKEQSWKELLPNVQPVNMAYGVIGEWHLSDKIGVMNVETGKLLGMRSDKYRFVPHEVGLNFVEEMVIKHAAVLGDYDVNVALHNEGQRMKATFRFVDAKYEVRKDDTVNPTVEYWNSYDGSWAEKLTFGAYRLVCKNGLLVGEKFATTRAIHVGERPEDFLLDIDKAVLNFEKQADLWKAWSDTVAKKKDIEGVLVAFPDATQEKIIAAIEALGKPESAVTIWELYNVLTQISTHETKSLQSRVNMEKTIAQVSESWTALAA